MAIVFSQYTEGVTKIEPESRSLWFRLLPVLPLQSHHVFSAALVLCVETSPLLCVYSERLPHDFQSSPVPARKEEHPITSPVSAAQRNSQGEDKTAAEVLLCACYGSTCADLSKSIPTG